MAIMENEKNKTLLLEEEIASLKLKLGLVAEIKLKSEEELKKANEEVGILNNERIKRAEELLLANIELAYQIEEKAKRAVELFVTNKELTFHIEEKAKQAEELLAANNEIHQHDKEKEERIKKIAEINANLYFERQLFEKTLISIGDGVIATDINKNVSFMNKIAESLTGWPLADALGKPIYTVFNIISEYTRNNNDDIISKVITTKSIHNLANHTILITRDASEKLIEDSAAPIIDIGNNVVGVVIVFRDYTEKWERLKQIQYINFHDDLTGLYNRRFFEAELSRLDVSRNYPMSIIMGDVNGLKLINDSFGHSLGDELLVKTANSLKEGCREDEIIARLGGDEFALILPNCSKTQTEKVVQRIKNSLSTQKISSMELSISFGYATKTDIDQDIKEILKESENSMYSHKLFESSSMRSRTIDLISKTLFEKSAREQVHSERVSILSVKLAELLGFSRDEMNAIELIGLMHDIGKIGIEDNILNKPSQLSSEEYFQIKKHPEIGARILSSVLEFSEISTSVLQHHEYWDGNGYPQGLKGEEIGIEARIISIADAYDAMTSHRTYSKQKSKEEAINEITRCSGTQFDPLLTKIFIDMILDNPSI
ncbi:MAG: diguanylate cyclase [Erysipelotrichaceae bacterium]|nr:diguanylate cyclase [Erysipelotrichaceae bacterium]